jgi:hypothetical protein
MYARLFLGVWLLAAAAALWAQGPGPGGGGSGSGSSGGSSGSGGGSSGSGSGATIQQISFHIPNEMAPPGGLVQMKFLLSVPTPISTGGPVLSLDAGMFDSVWGIQLFCPDGDLNGVAMVNGSNVNIRYATTAGAAGTDYPIMTVALHIRPDAVPGAATQFQLNPSSWWTLNPSGAETTVKPGSPATVTVGGSISILDVVPGGGVLPAGTVVSIKGMGFQPKTQVQLNAIKSSSIQFINSGEIQFTLAEATDMTGQKIQVVNPDNSQDTYFSYLRGITLARSSQSLLQAAVPIFSSVTHSSALFTPITAASGSQFTGVAIQNPSVAPANVTMALYSSTDVPLGSSSFTLPSEYRLMGSTPEFTQGVVPASGNYLVVTSTQPIQVFGFLADNSLGTILPFAAAVAQ